MPFTEFPIPTKDLATAKSELLLAMGLENVDNTADADKPVSTAQAAADDAAQAAAEGTAQAALDNAVGTLNTAIGLKQDAATAVRSVRPDANHQEASTFLIGNILAIYESAYNILAGINPAGPDNTDPNTTYLIVEDPAP